MFSLIWAMAGGVSSDEVTGSAGAGASGLSTLLMFGGVILLMYFLMIRPQRKRDKEARQMMAALKKGDKIVTIGGIRGTIVAVRENTVIVKVDSDARIEFNKTAVAQVLNAGAVSASESKEEKSNQVGFRAEAETVKPEAAEVTESGSSESGSSEGSSSENANPDDGNTETAVEEAEAKTAVKKSAAKKTAKKSAAKTSGKSKTTGKKSGKSKA